MPRLENVEALSIICDRVDRGPHVPRRPNAGRSGVLNWADWLLTRGFADADVLLPLFDWWCEAYRSLRPGLVVADFAPVAQLAARAMRVPLAVTGAPFFTLPSGMDPIPDYLTPQDAAAHGTVLADVPPPDQTAIRDRINDALVPRGLPQMSRLAQVYAADIELARGVGVFDPYASWRDSPLLLPTDEMPLLPDRPGDEVFVYFSTAELTDPATCEALRRLSLPSRLLLSGVPPDLARDLAAKPNLKIERAPLSHAQIVARSRVILCAGQAGTLSLAVLAGIPVVALPVQLEQLSNALRASRHLSGVRVLPKMARSPEGILAAVEELWSSPAAGQTARQDAMPLRAAFAETAQDAYRRRMLPVLRGPSGGPRFFLRDPGPPEVT